MASGTALVVGAGISGIACAGALAGRGFDVQVRERGRVLGGRMASRRLKDTGTRWDGRYVDIGASYFTARHPAFLAVVDRLRTAGIVDEWTDAFHVSEPEGPAGVRLGPMRYRAPGGLRSVVEALAEQAAAEPEQPGSVAIGLESEVREVRPEADRVLVDGEAFDAVALCMPVPQAARLVAPGTLPAEALELVWEPVVAVTLVFGERTWGDLDGVFVNDDPVITWIADDGRRRGDDAPVLVAHVNPVLAARHLDDVSAVLPAAIAAVRHALRMPDMPQWADAHRWTFAKPMSALPEPCWTGGRLGLAGDGFAAGPRVETAWISGNSLGSGLVG